MKAVWYEKQGPAREAIIVGECRSRRQAQEKWASVSQPTGINPGDIRKRQDDFG